MVRGCFAGPYCCGWYIGGCFSGKSLNAFTTGQQKKSKDLHATLKDALFENHNNNFEKQ